MKQITVARKIAYSFNQVAINMLWQAFNTVAVFYYVTDLKVPGTALSIGMVAFGIVNAFLNGIAGHWSDRTQSRWGRRIPYILFGSLPFSAMFFLLFSPPDGSVSMHIFYFFGLTFLFDVCYTFTALNAGALYPEMYQTKWDRSFVASFQQLFAIMGLIAGVALSKSLGETMGWRGMAGVFAVIALASMYTSLYGSFENPMYREAPLQFKQAVMATLRNKRFLVYVVASLFIQLVTTLFTSLTAYYGKYVVPLNATENALFLGLMFIVAIPFSFVWSRMYVRFSASGAALVATALFGVMALSFCFANSVIVVIATGACLGIPVAGFLVLLNILLAEIIDHDWQITGQRREGMYLGMNGFIVRIGMSLQYAIMGVFFATSGYTANSTVQTTSTLRGFRFLLGGLPAILLGIAVILLLQYRRFGRRIGL